ncbi:50S ribosomal protein L3 [Candidatus Dojkabacteria bacterium]|uniref:50S ribosomal protein L3 n=1 Tax=Candidatus Dojkabacteria bacterium TaxID=2099670 RepID=A0A3M0Z221_9BACT|nr:MAG: 50S ribosomal protein L3 [Candidatus Dojkabacteria bacterium]
MITFFSDDGKAVPSTVLTFDNVEVVNSSSLNKKFIVMLTKKNSSNKLSVKKQIGLDLEKSYDKFVSLDKKHEDLMSVLSCFGVGQVVSVTGVTKGKGFQGVVKRWGFAGGPRTHGQSDRERAPGAIGSRTIPGRVFKGKKMAGRMGQKTVTVKGLKVMDINLEDKYIIISGSIPGPKKSVVILKSK